jgi:hypothetical protein
MKIAMISDYLYELNKHRGEMQDKLDKRRAFVLSCLIVVLVTVSVFLWTTYR